MNLLELKSKLEKGKSLQGEVVYIKEDNLICGIESVYKNQENKNVTLLKSKEESIKVDYLIKILEELYANLGDVEVVVCSEKFNRTLVEEIKSVEFAQYELMKMLFLNI
ncbi:hypothetical protein CHF27_000545 [Romboutsia maritimum]|uniref:Uncharacterized protein n=1 Tax=Romboutsia maritimum TaxID=2020948 RepID=A0A371IW65_9FIRM|nr:hypothetical protein [Romboutsia maritimum]RDY24721.1 hypothetical protein CHF27_000545 [Romboutsia maritimum]